MDRKLKFQHYCLRQVDSCLHCKFRNGAWRPRAAFQDSEFPNEDRIIDIDGYGEAKYTTIELLRGLLSIIYLNKCEEISHKNRIVA